MKKSISLYVMSVFYLLAGINHFRIPESYQALIPPYLGNEELINILSGVAEVVLALMLLLKSARKWACYGIIIMLLAFVPAHIYMLQKGFCVDGHCAPGWLLWARLLVFQPLLIFWAWNNRE